MTVAQLQERITTRLQEAADDAFDPEEAIDSDGEDQAAREAFLEAIDVVNGQFRDYFINQHG